jgi:hypothetical protein
VSERGRFRELPLLGSIASDQIKEKGGHQPSAGVGGTAADIAIQAEEFGKSKRRIAERGNWMARSRPSYSG